MPSDVLVRFAANVEDAMVGTTFRKRIVPCPISPMNVVVCSPS
jgi:hypothetical protein